MPIPLLPVEGTRAITPARGRVIRTGEAVTLAAVTSTDALSLQSATAGLLAAGALWRARGGVEGAPALARQPTSGLM